MSKGCERNSLYTQSSKRVSQSIAHFRSRLCSSRPAVKIITMITKIITYNRESVQYSGEVTNIKDRCHDFLNSVHLYPSACVGRRNQQADDGIYISWHQHSQMHASTLIALGHVFCWKVIVLNFDRDVDQHYHQQFFYLTGLDVHWIHA